MFLKWFHTKRRIKAWGVQLVKKKGSKMADTMVVEGDQTGGVDGTLTRWIDECQLSTQRILMDTLVLVEVHRYPLHNLYLYFSTHNLNLRYIVIFAHSGATCTLMTVLGWCTRHNCHVDRLNPCKSGIKWCCLFFCISIFNTLLISGSWLSLFSLPRRSAPSRSGRLCRGQGQVQINWPARAQSPGTERSNKVSARN